MPDPQRGRLTSSSHSSVFTLKQQGFSFLCLCQCLCSQSLDLALRSLSFTRQWNRKATKKFLNKPLQLEPHLAFSSVQPRTFSSFSLPVCALGGLESLFAKECHVVVFFLSKISLVFLPGRRHWSGSEHRGNLQGARKFVVWLHITQRKLKTWPKICTACVVGVLKISWEF